MFTTDETIMVAVSGGKDSLALWDVLIEDGYRTAGLYLDLGIFDYSKESRAKCEAFAEARGLTLHVERVAEAVGAPIPVVQQATRRPHLLGVRALKRYLMNRAALEHGYPVVATGHNLDDEAATLFGSVMHWQTDALPRQSPALASTHPKLVRRVKPLYRLSELETAAYAFLRGIDYIVEECPFAKGATSIAHKQVLDRLEEASPGSKHNFLFGFLDQRPARVRAGGARRAARVHLLRPGDHRDGLRLLQARRSGQAAHGIMPPEETAMHNAVIVGRGPYRRRPEERQARRGAPRRPAGRHAQGARRARQDRPGRGRGRGDGLRGPGGRAGVQHRPQRRADRGVPAGRLRHHARPHVRLGPAGGQLRRAWASCPASTSA